MLWGVSLEGVRECFRGVLECMSVFVGCVLLVYCGRCVSVLYVFVV